MKVLTVNDAINALRTSKDYKEFTFKLLREVKLVDAIPIPEGATNGDAMKTMFNVEILFVSEQFNVITVRYDNHSKTYDLSWWNAPYKRMEE